jgi:hypothetical protein
MRTPATPPLLHPYNHNPTKHSPTSSITKPLTYRHRAYLVKPHLRNIQLAKKKTRTRSEESISRNMSARPPPPPPSTSAATPKPKPSTSRTPKPAAPRPRSPETHLSFNTRNMAAEILQSYEQLAWYALARNEVSLIELQKKRKTSRNAVASFRDLGPEWRKLSFLNRPMFCFFSTFH